MSELYKRIEALCKEEGITVTEMCRRAGVPRANLTELKMGRQQTLGLNSLEKIAQYFRVSVGALASSEEKEPASNAEPGAVSDDELKFAMFGTTEISDEKLAEIRRYAQYIKDL